jgi:hypothetical protein
VLGKLLYRDEREMERKLKELDAFSIRVIRERRAKLAEAAAAAAVAAATTASTTAAAAAAAATASATTADGGGGGGGGRAGGGASSQQQQQQQPKATLHKSSSRRGAAVGQDCLSLFLDESFASARYTDKQLQGVVMSILIAGECVSKRASGRASGRARALQQPRSRRHTVVVVFLFASFLRCCHPAFLRAGDKTADRNK